VAFYPCRLFETGKEMSWWISGLIIHKGDGKNKFAETTKKTS